MKSPIVRHLETTAALLDDPYTREAVARDLQDVYLRDYRAQRFMAEQDDLRHAYANVWWIGAIAFAVGWFVGRAM